jgi:hypothetical protein
VAGDAVVAAEIAPVLRPSPFRDYAEVLNAFTYGLIAQPFCALGFGYSAQTWDENSLSRCNSNFRIISSKDLPAAAPGELNTQAHWEQPKP